MHYWHLIALLYHNYTRYNVLQHFAALKGLMGNSDKRTSVTTLKHRVAVKGLIGTLRAAQRQLMHSL